MLKQGLKNGLLNAIVSVGWTHKIQEKQAERYASFEKNWTMIQLISAGLTATGTFAVLISDTHISKVLTVIVGLISFVSSGVLKAYNFKSLATESKEYANRQFQLREMLMDCLRDLAFELKPLDNIQERWEQLESKRLSMGSSVPSTSDKAVNKASVQLKNRRDNVTDTDYELFISRDILNELCKSDNKKGDSNND